MRTRSKSTTSKVERIEKQTKKLERRKKNFLKELRECHEDGDRANINRDITMIQIQIENNKEFLQKALEKREEKGNICIDCGRKVPEKRVNFLKELNLPITCIACAVFFSGSKVHKSHQAEVISLISETYGIGMKEIASLI